MKQEECVEIILWDWLKTKGKNVKEIYFNRKNELNAPTFQTKKLNKKPDFLIELRGGDFIALEIKDETNSKNILDSGKILDIYYKNYVERKTKYFIKDKEIKIDYFAIASGKSMKGHLFKEEEFVFAMDSKNKSKRYVASIGLIPKVEGNKSHVFVRDLWSRHNRLEKSEEKPAIGILISKGIRPMIFCKKFIEEKKRWSQRFLEI